MYELGPVEALPGGLVGIVVAAVIARHGDAGQESILVVVAELYRV